MEGTDLCCMMKVLASKKEEKKKDGTTRNCFRDSEEREFALNANYCVSKSPSSRLVVHLGR